MAVGGIPAAPRGGASGRARPGGRRPSRRIRRPMVESGGAGRQPRAREMSIHHSQDFFATGDALTLIVPSRLLGVLALAADLQNYGEQENTTDPSVPSTGTVLTRSFVLSASYAAPIGNRAFTGLAFKVVQMRVDCTGPCDFPTRWRRPSRSTPGRNWTWAARAE